MTAPPLLHSLASTEEAEHPATIEVGQWYWVNEEDDKKKWFGCVVHVGTNYAEVESPQRDTSRIHFDEFWTTCTYEANPDAIIGGKIGHYQTEVARLLGRVKEVTASLAITPSPMLNAGSETQALALRGSGQDIGDYSKALVKAKDEALPDLFKQIKSANESLAQWMTATIVPLKAQAAGLRGLIGAIDERIFSVELYAGLVEKIERIADGAPAALGEKVRLLQRRCYMDEECLAQYETGGMVLRDIDAFDKWITRADNLNRLLPFPRCLVAFRVRRDVKEREGINLRDFIQILEEEKTDKVTFLYIRNGERVYRLRTGIEFDEKLFPDLERGRLTGKLWAYRFSTTIDKLISDNEYQAILAEDIRRDAAAKAKRAAAPKKDRWWHSDHSWESRHYLPYDKSSVYYDDITAKVEDEIRQHNRIALILQGLLDRSPVLHPHPPWQIWTDEGFHAALELIYDTSRALVAGDKPDFEAYRARLNEALTAGAVTVGQEDVWEQYEGRKESERLANDWRNKTDWRPTRFKPYGNPGPGAVARVARYSSRAKKCTYEWTRDRLTGREEGAPIHTSFATDAKYILNVDAYKPGDFKQFFNDPRTRMEYLKWAPLLLEAEEYHAGNREVSAPPPPKPKKEGSSWEGKLRYKQQKLKKQLMGKAVRLTREVTTKGGSKYEAGSLWRVISSERGTFSIVGINKDGTREEGDRWVSNTRSPDFEVDASVPPEPEDS